MGHLRGMQSAVDVNDGLALSGQCPCGLVGKLVGMGQPQRDLAIALQVREVLCRRDHCDVPGMALGRLADLQQRHPIAGGCQASEIRHRLVVGREKEVCPDTRSQHRLRGWDGRLGGSGGGSAKTEKNYEPAGANAFHECLHCLRAGKQ